MLLINGNIISVTGDRIINGFILIRDKSILEFGDMCELVDIEEHEVIDVKGNYILPGFVDGHSHMGIMEDGIGDIGKDHNETSDAITPQLKASYGIYYNDKSFEEAYKNGVTTVVVGPGSANVIGGQFAAMKTYGITIEDMLIKEPVAIKASLGENPKTVYGKREKAPCTRMAIANMLRMTLYRAKIYSQQSIEDRVFDEKLEALMDVMNKDIPLKIHAHREDDILTAIRIAKEFDINIIIVHCTSGYLVKEILSKENIPVMLGPLLIHRFRVEHRGLELSTPAILAKERIGVSLISDHPWVPTKHLSICAAAAIREGLGYDDALKSITINPAKMLGISNRVGSIDVGKDADLIVMDGDPLDVRSRVIMTILEGRIIYTRGGVM